MADSDIVVSALATAAGISYNALTYATDDPHEGGLLNQSLDVVEIWASQTNDRTTATKVAEGNKTNALHVALGNGETWYYWIKARNKAVGPSGERYYGEWYPLSPTGGIEGTTAVITSSESGVSWDTDWTTWTPSVSASSGTITTLGTVFAQYTLLGPKTIAVNIAIGILDKGTATGAVLVTTPPGLPIQPGTIGPVGSGVRPDNSILTVFGSLNPFSCFYITLYNGSFPIGNGDVMFISIVYRTP